MIAGLLLAAGESRRFGSNKLLHKLENGESLVVTCAKKLAPHVDKLLVVTRPGDDTVEQLLTSNNLSSLTCPNAANGMGAALAFGVDQTKHAQAWIIALADMPFIEPGDYKNCAAALQNSASLTAPRYKKNRGHPVGIAKPWRRELLALSGDQGARELFKQNESRIVYFAAQNSGVLRDIDTLEDIRH